MKTLSLDLKLDGLKLEGEDKEKTPRQLASVVLKNIVLIWASQNRGLNEDDRRRYYKISDVLETAEKENLNSVDLEDDWIGFLKKCRREALAMPSELFRRVEEMLGEVKDR